MSLMRLLQLALVLVLAISPAAQAEPLTAITKEGKIVYLYEDGTWSYENKNKNKTLTISQKTNSNIPQQSTANVSNKHKTLEVWFDNSKWRLNKQPSNADAEFEWDHVNGDGYSMIIAERIPIPLDNLKNIALDNAKNIAPDARIIDQQMITVNGTELLAMKMAFTAQGIPFIYYGYYASGSFGAIQFITYTADALFAEYELDFADLLNGLVLHKQN